MSGKSYEDTLEELFAIGRFGSKLGLENITLLLKKLGNPHEGMKFIHVAGTNGKGSVTAMIACILKEAGYKVGSYYSPHVYSFTERFLINGNPVSKEDVVRLYDKVMEQRTDQTFFEIITAMALVYFKEQNVDFAVLETGLGGRLDATNVVTPLISVITTIGKEHTRYLGETEDSIAREKAGIIKKGVPVVTGTSGKASQVIEEQCRIKGCSLAVISKPWPGKIGMRGDFQRFNAALAAVTVEHIRSHLEFKDEYVEKGLEHAYLPGRFEFIQDDIIFDCAHNPQGMEALGKELEKLGRKIVLVIGLMRDKNCEGILNIIEPLCDTIILTKADDKKAADPADLQKLISNKNKAIIKNNVKEAFAHAQSIRKDELIVVTGSFYVIGELKE